MQKRLTETIRPDGRNFHKIQIQDQKTINEFVRRSQYPANLWSSNFPYLWAVSQTGQRTVYWKIIDNMLTVFVLSYKGTLYLQCLPFGMGNAVQVVDVLKKCLAYCENYNHHDRNRTCLKMINDGQLEFLKQNPEFLKTFRLVTWQGVERHLDVHRLVSPSGKEFENVRNRLNKFRREHPDAEISRYRPDNYDELMRLAGRWEETSGKKYRQIYDNACFREIIRHSQELGQIILIMRLNGRMIGMIAGSLLPTGQSWGSFVKFESGFPGLSETLIIEMVREINKLDPAVRYLNIGSDLGEAGLRNYKLKYRPILNYKRYEIFYR